MALKFDPVKVNFLNGLVEFGKVRCAEYLSGGGHIRLAACISHNLTSGG